MGAGRVRGRGRDWAHPCTQAGPTPIQALEQHGINASDVKKLNDAGLYTAESVGGRG